MGSGASNTNPELQKALADKQNDSTLTAEEKAKINSKIALKYAELTADSNKSIKKSASGSISASDKLELEESTDLFSTLQKEYDAEAEKIKAARNAYGRTFQMLKQKSTNYFGEAPTSGSTFIFNVTKSDSTGNSPSGSFKGGSPFQQMQRQQTSKELIEALHSNSSPISSSAEQVEENVKVFVDQLKSGEVKTKKASEFRKKRLTYDFQEAQSGGEKDTSPPTPPSGGMGARQSSMNPHRKASIRGPATIFTADEIGAVQNGIVPPFPSTVVGVFSCHGVEPGKIRQYIVYNTQHPLLKYVLPRYTSPCDDFRDIRLLHSVCHLYCLYLTHLDD